MNFIRNIALSPRTKYLFGVLFVIFIGHELFVNYSSSTYARCDKLETDKVHFELYRDTEREVYKNVLVLLTEEQVRLGCIEK